jgi:2-oxoacid:acceptor oxidoreductase gamma subunit (pyruvate/2-ketoisovalerate family)
MLEIVFYGRGGQGCLIASKILAYALFQSGKYVQAFPAFGGERRGAPVKAFLRTDEKTIRRRSMIYEADYAIVFDETLLEEIPIQEEVKGDSLFLINSSNPIEYFMTINAARIRTINANAIASDMGLGTPTAPIVNTIILGAFTRLSGLVDIDFLFEGIKKYIEDRPEINISGAVRAYEEINDAGKGGAS